MQAEIYKNHNKIKNTQKNNVVTINRVFCELCQMYNRARQSVKTTNFYHHYFSTSTIYVYAVPKKIIIKSSKILILLSTCYKCKKALNLKTNKKDLFYREYLQPIDIINHI
jgi:hypothetical protein